MNQCIPCQQGAIMVVQPALGPASNPVIATALAQLSARGITPGHPLVAQELNRVLGYAMQVAQPIELPPWDACMRISVSIPPRCFAVGEEVPITLTATSGGPSDVCRNNIARNAYLDLVWIDPTKVEIVDAAGGQPVIELDIAKLRWSLGNLAPGQSVTRTPRFRVKQAVPCIGFDACSFALNAPAACFPAIFCVSPAPTAPPPGLSGTNWLPLVLLGGALGLGLLWAMSQQQGQGVT